MNQYAQNCTDSSILPMNPAMSNPENTMPATPNSQASGLSQGAHLIDAKYEGHRYYRVMQTDSKVFTHTAKELAEGSQLVSNLNLWTQNFRVTLDQVSGWCQKRTDKVRAALVDVRANKVAFYFIPACDGYDVDLGDEMTDLEVELGGSAGIGYVETLRVPSRSITRFAGPKSIIVWQRPNDDVFEFANQSASDEDFSEV